MFCCGRVLVHTQFVGGFHLHVGVEYLCIHYSGCYDVFICIRGDGLRDERKLVPHILELV